MKHWLLLETPVGEHGQAKAGLALPLTFVDFSFGELGTGFELGDLADVTDRFFEAAQSGGECGAVLLRAEGWLKSNLTGRFAMPERQRRSDQDSAGLLFALAVLSQYYARYCRDPLGIPDFAATGAVNAAGIVGRVEGVALKVAAALDVLPPGGVILFPLENRKDVDDALHERAQARLIRLEAVEHLSSAARKLGMPIVGAIPDFPYPGLKPFEYLDHRVYFGRAAEVRRLCELLLAREAQGRPGLLLVAPSGAGKTSFLQAGLLPALDFGEHALTDRKLLRQIWRVDPAQGTDEESLVRSIQAAWSQLLGSAFTDPATSLASLGSLLSARVVDKGFRFIWIVDQLEQLFAGGFSQTVVSAFAQFIRQLRTDGVWVLCALRADFYASYLGCIDLFNVYGNGDIFNLAALDDRAIQDIISLPAEFAGLSFEPDENGTRLSSELIADVLSAARFQGAVNDVLPQLASAMRQLHDGRDRDRRQLLWATYRQMGGLGGAIAKAADHALQQASVEAQASLPVLVVALADIQLDSDSNARFGGVIARTADTDRWPLGSPVRELLDVLRREHLLSDMDDPTSTRRHVRVVHEALLRVWAPARKALEDNLAAVLLRRRIHDRARIWNESGRLQERLLQSGLELEEAKGLLDHGDLVDDPVDRNFLDRSIKHARRKFWYRSLGVTVLFLSTCFTGFYLWRSYQAYVVKNLETAGKYRAAGIAASIDGDTDKALAYLAAALRLNSHDEDIQGHLMLLIDSSRWTFLRQRSLIPVPIQGNAGISPDGTKILTVSAEGTMQIWDSQTGQRVGTQMENGEKVSKVAFSPDGTLIASATHSGLGTGARHKIVIRLWETGSGRPIGAPIELGSGSQAHVSDIAFTPNSSRFVTASWDGTARIWDAHSGLSLGQPMVHQGAIYDIDIDSKGVQIVTASSDGTARLWNAETGVPIDNPMFPGWSNPAPVAGASSPAPVTRARFSPDATRLVTVQDGDARLWDTTTGAQIGASMTSSDGLAVATIDFSLDGARLVTMSANGKLNYWEGHGAQRLTNVTSDPMSLDSVGDIALRASADRSVVVSQQGDFALIDTPRAPIFTASIQSKNDVAEAYGDYDHSTQITEESALRQYRLERMNPTKLGENAPPLRSLSFPGDNLYFVAIHKNGSAYLWSNTRSDAEPIQLRTTPIRSAHFSLDGNRLATVQEDGTLQLWDVNSGAALSPALWVSNGMVKKAYFSRDGSHVVCFLTNGALSSIHFPKISPSEIASLISFAELVAGQHLGSDGKMRALDDLEKRFNSFRFDDSRLSRHPGSDLDRLFSSFSNSPATQSPLVAGAAPSPAESFPEKSDSQELPYRWSDLGVDVDLFLKGTKMPARRALSQGLTAAQFHIQYSPTPDSGQVVISDICFSIDKNYSTPYPEINWDKINEGREFSLMFGIRSGDSKILYGVSEIENLTSTNGEITNNGVNYNLGNLKVPIKLKVALPDSASLKEDLSALRLWTVVVVNGDSAGTGSGPALFADYLRPSLGPSGICG